MIRDLETEANIKKIWDAVISTDDKELRDLLLDAHRSLLSQYSEWRREKSILFEEQNITRESYINIGDE